MWVKKNRKAFLNIFKRDSDIHETNVCDLLM